MATPMIPDRFARPLPPGFGGVSDSGFDTTIVLGQ